MAYYSYAPITYNLTTSWGYSDHITSLKHIELLIHLDKSFNEKKCLDVKSKLNQLQTKSVISSKCSFLKECGFKILKSHSQVCLAKL